MRKQLLVGMALVAAVATATPSSALSVSAGVTGGITVGPDFTACATLTFPPGRVFVGTFSAVGEMQGPGTKYGTVRGAMPIVGYGTWSACIAGSYEGATVGEGKFTLTASSTTEDYAEVKQCVINRGSVTCY